MSKYTAIEIKKILEQNPIAETLNIKRHLIEVFSLLNKELVDKCFKEINFIEMDKWGEYCSPCKPFIKNIVIRISQETLDLNPKISKFIFLHEIGHFLNEKCLQKPDQTKREEQDKKADSFASRYFPDWKRYFIRDKNNNLRLTKLGERYKK